MQADRVSAERNVNAALYSGVEHDSIRAAITLPCCSRRLLEGSSSTV